MKVTVEELSPSKRVLCVELPPERVAERVEATFREWGQKLQLPGFRRGRVPREIIRRRFESEVHEEVLRDLIPDSYREALAQAAIEPVSQPAVEDVHFHAGEPLTYRAVVEIKPSVTATDYRGIPLEREKVEVTDQELNRALEYLREDAAEYVPMEGWPALRDDLVVLDHEGILQGKPFKGGTGKNLTVALGHEGYLPGFTEQLAGMQKGESKRFSLQMPADYPRKELAGRSVEFRVTVKEVKKRRVPELNDDFAKTVGDVETLGALREKLRQQLLQRKTREQDAALKRRLLEKLVQQHAIDVPETMVDRETAAVLQELAMTLRATGGRVEGLPDDPEALKATARETAMRRVKESLLLEAVARQEQLTVTDEEIAAEVNNLAGAYRQEPAAVRRALEDPARRAGLTGRLAERKALDFLFQHATVTDAYRLIVPA
ncbi:MAG: trigger factor [Zetaproteobacteria bacterium]|nr:MAG: trigger factor [Zetaproteobacteria bacterium]